MEKGRASPATPTRPRGATKACSACHRRKIKCDGSRPSCGPCRRTGATCYPHERTEKSNLSTEAAEAMRQRISWLENELEKLNSIPDVKSIPTGTDLVDKASSPRDHPTNSSGEDRSISNNFVDTSLDSFTAEIGVLSLNAVGDMRFQGSVTGIVFCKLAAAAARKLLDVDIKTSGSVYQMHNRQLFSNPQEKSLVAPKEIDLDFVPPRSVVDVLLEAYLVWIHVIYPIFHIDTLETIVDAVCNNPEEVSLTRLAIFHLVMALGSIHQRSFAESNMPEGCTTAELFTRAMAKFDYVLVLDGIEGLQIVLLLAIYASFRPSGSTQWHILGMAMRICVDLGLHRQNHNWNFTQAEWDLRRRLFWSTYAMDRMVCFNIGRPATLADEHIDALFPEPGFDRNERSKGIGLAIHHVRVRAIQSRLIHDVFSIARPDLSVASKEARLQIVLKLQQELETWRHDLYAIYNAADSPHSLGWYDRLYHSTTLSLHRPTPLLPIPSEESLLRCYSSSSAMLITYHESLRNSELEQSWMLLNGCFFSGITLLYAIWSSTTVLQSVRLDEVMERIRQCSIVLAVMAERWDAAAEFRDTFEQLAGPTTRRLINNLQNNNNNNANNNTDSIPPQISLPSLAPTPPPQSEELNLTSAGDGWDDNINFELDQNQMESLDMMEFFEDIMRGRNEFWDNV